MFFIGSGRGEAFKTINGSWSKSCEKIKQQDGLLNAKCKDKNGKWNNTSVNVNSCNWKVKNDNGVLKCE